ncbi:deoxyribose-phosphate aldolase [Bacteriovoracales bacterium]|nr:deoxyribose-phosphate aldolase [Bacteriovoracales bacterium]
MKEKINNLDEVVSLITKKVAERLGGQEQKKSHNETEVAKATDYDQKLASMIDHTFLKPEASKEQLEKLCGEARAYNFATVCVNSCNIPLVTELLRGSSVKPIAVVGFPLGAATVKSKVFEAKEAIAAGAREIDMVVNLGALKSRDYKTVFEDIQQVVEASSPYPVKVILETSSLDDEEKVVACALSKTAGAAFVKTSTGFGGGGATVNDIKMMRRIVGDSIGVKASGGVRTTEDAKSMVEAGANRVGASSSIAIVKSPSAEKGGRRSYGKRYERKTYSRSTPQRRTQRNVKSDGY